MTKAAQPGGFSKARGNPLWSWTACFLLAGYVTPLCGLLLLFALPAPAQPQNELAVRAAFVYNLTKYVEWPRPSSSLLIGVVGDGPMGDTLKQLAGKTSESRAIKVVISPSDEAITKCNVLYISYQSPKKIKVVLDKVRRSNVLTVGEVESFAKEGGIVGLVTVGDHVQIQVNLETAQENQLKISSRLLNLATVVHPTSGARN